MFAKASAFRMSIPKLERAPASEAKSAGLSRATMVARYTPPCFSISTAAPVGRLSSLSWMCDLNLGRGVSSQIASGKAFDEGRHLGKLGRDFLNAAGFEFTHQHLMGDAIRLPELLQSPGRHGRGIDGGDVGVGEDGQQLELLDGADALGQHAGGGGIVEVA